MRASPRSYAEVEMSGIRRAMLLAHFCVLLSSTAYTQSVPCGDLPDTKAQIYFDLAAQAHEEYVAKNYEGSIQKGVKAMALCQDDWQVVYNLSRAYHQAGQCGMALYLYDELLGRKGIDKKQRKKIQGYQGEMKKACGASTAVVSIVCRDNGVQLEVGVGLSTGCPFAGRLEAGSYELKARRTGYFDYTASFEVVAATEQSVDVPFLVSLDTVGRLAVSCDPEITEFNVSGPDLNDRLPCPWEGELGVGSYTISYEDQEAPLVVEVVGQQTARISLLDEASSTGPVTITKGSGVLLGLAVSSGMGYASGVLEDAGPHTGEDTAGPSYGTLAGLFSIGYAINPNIAVLARVRVDRGLGIMGLGVFRYTTWFGESFGLQLFGGAGGGEIVHPVFLDVGGSGAFRSSPVFVLAGVKGAIPLSDLMALSFGLDTYIEVYSGFSVLADLALGLEFKF